MSEQAVSMRPKSADMSRRRVRLLLDKIESLEARVAELEKPKRRTTKKAEDGKAGE